MEWPPASERERLDMYENNRKLFESKHGEVFKDWNRILREDQQASLLIALSFHERLSTLWADLLLGEPPTFTAGEAETPEQNALDELVKLNNLVNTAYETVIDNSRFGEGVFKIRFEKRGIIESQPPSCWFPVVDPTNIKNTTAHVLGWTWEDVMISFGKEVIVKYLQVEIHEVGKITTRRYVLDGSVISRQVEIEGVEEEVFTGVDDFLVHPFHNLITSDRCFGIDDYSKIDPIVQEIEIRLSQISRILDKHSDPNMYGPDSALVWDPETHQYQFKSGGKYFPVEAGDQTPGYMIWDGQLAAAFMEFDKLMELLYLLTETSPAAFGQLKAGLAESGSALKRLMMAPLAKTGRNRTRLDPTLKRVLQVAAALEVQQGMTGAAELPDVGIEWADGVPNDDREQASIDNESFTAGTVSLESILKRRGLTGDNLQNELDAIRGVKKEVEVPEVVVEEKVPEVE